MYLDDLAPQAHTSLELCLIVLDIEQLFSLFVFLYRYLIKVEIDHFPPPNFSDCYYCWHGSHKESINADIDFNTHQCTFHRVNAAFFPSYFICPTVTWEYRPTQTISFPLLVSSMTDALPWCYKSSPHFSVNHQTQIVWIVFTMCWEESVS